MQVQPAKAGETYRVRVQYETSLGLSAEGPHLDLTDWKHCVSDWEAADALDEMLALARSYESLEAPSLAGFRLIPPASTSKVSSCGYTTRLAP